MHAVHPRTTVALIAVLHFVYILDFMMPMPLGPDLAAALAFGGDRLGWISAAYMLGSIASSLLAVRWLDRFPRRQVMLWSVAAFALCTLATAAVATLEQLLVVRALTGLFGGPAIAVGMAAVVDVTPPDRRGRAIGRVMLGFSLAAIAGIPAALELARIGGWQTPFIAVAALAFALLAALAWWMPDGRAAAEDDEVSLRSLLARPAVRVACAAQAASQFASFLIVPVFSAFLLSNAGYPREDLGTLYLVGGVVAMIVMQALGWLVDRAGAMLAVTLASCSLVLGLAGFFGYAAVPAMLLLVLFMAGNAGKTVSLGAALSMVPAPHERAGFMALKGLVEDVAIVIAALASALVLGSDADGRLTGTATLAGLACAASGFVLVAVFVLHRSGDPAFEPSEATR